MDTLRRARNKRLSLRKKVAGHITEILIVKVRLSKAYKDIQLYKPGNCMLSWPQIVTHVISWWVLHSSHIEDFPSLQLAGGYVPESLLFLPKECLNQWCSQFEHSHL